MFWNAKEKTLRISNKEFDYIQFGSGKKTLIMIQGLNTNGIHGAAVSLAYMYRMFSREYTVYVFDRRKYIEKEITVREIAQDIAEAMDALKIRKADIFGVSQGGMIAQYLAIDRPDLVHKMVLAVTLSRNNKTVENCIRNWIRMTEYNQYKELIRDMAVKMYSDAYIKRYRFIIPLLTLVQKPKDPERFIRMAQACLSCDTYEELYKIQCPVLVIGGSKDQIVTGAASLEMAEKLQCDCYMYEDLGHAAYEEAKDFNQRVLAFFKEES